MNKKIKRQLQSFLGKLALIKYFRGLIVRLFAWGNKELYKRSLIKLPALKISVSSNWVRVPMYNAIYIFFEQLSKKENLKNKIAIEIGGSERSIKTILEKFGINYKVAPNFPEVDIQKLPYKNNSFDFLIVDQVLEHVEKPWIAVEEVFRVLKPGGICVTTGPLMFCYHGGREHRDYFRFTPDGWKSLFSKFKILETAGWGNNLAVKASLDSSADTPAIGQTIPVTEAIQKRYLESNDQRNYLVTWCIARKT